MIVVDFLFRLYGLLYIPVVCLFCCLIAKGPSKYSKLKIIGIKSMNQLQKHLCLVTDGLVVENLGYPIFYQFFSTFKHCHCIA